MAAKKKNRTPPTRTGRKRKLRRQKPIAFTAPAGDERVLALDTSSKCVGWAVFDNGQLTQHGRYVQQGESHGERLATFRRWIDTMLAEFQPTQFIYEAHYFGRNGKTFAVLSMYAGVVEACYFEHYGVEMPVESKVPAREVKRAIGAPKVTRPKRTKRGTKSPKVDVHEQNKRLVTQLINERFGLALKYQQNDKAKTTSQDDEADAIALGWAWHLLHRAAEVSSDE